MSTKPVIISSSGLKNIVLNTNQDNGDFTFVFGKEKFQMKNIFAEFISPVVSRFHQTDPTINTIDFNKIAGIKQSDFNKFSKSLLTSNTISHLQKISSGSTIKINEEDAIKLRILSIILGNDELHQILNELFPTNYSEDNINTYMKNIECLYHFSQFNENFDFSTAISFISSHFYLLNVEDFLRASREIQYKIISHEELQIESEDILFDIISQIIEKGKNDDEEISDVLFLEQIEFIGLSESKFVEFISDFDFNEMSGQLWQNLCQCFVPHQAKKCRRKLKGKYQHQHQQKKNDSTLQGIIIGGADYYNVLGKNPNNKDKSGNPIISPPMKLTFDHSSILSYSAYNDHSVLIMSDGSLKGIGYNSDGRISGTLQRNVVENFADFRIKHRNGRHITPISAVCSTWGTLYMFAKSSHGNKRQLVLCDKDVSRGNPVFLEIGNHHPVALFAGYNHMAAVCSDGEIIFINHFLAKKSFNPEIEAISLPDGEKASTVACCKETLFVLSTNGRVFSSIVSETEGSSLDFSPVSELSGHEIVCLSGTNMHCFAVDKDGSVFGCGSNRYGQLGLGKRKESSSSFTRISSLSSYEIKTAYAGGYHSLFKTSEGKIIGCGANDGGELMLSRGPGKDVYTPTETIITSGADFIIAGIGITVVFMGNPPPNTPNMQIQES